MSAATAYLGASLRGARRAAIVLATLALAGCLGPEGEGIGGFFDRIGNGGGRAALAEVSVQNGDVVIGGPPGFCVDVEGTLDGPEGAFVLVGGCAVITGNSRHRMPERNALLTASVSSPVAEVMTPDQLAAFFSTEAGREALSRSGEEDAGSVVVHDMTPSPDTLVIHATDGAAPRLGPVTPDYWRAVFMLNTHLVTVTVNSFSRDPLSEEEGVALLADYVARIRRLSP